MNIHLSTRLNEIIEYDFSEKEDRGNITNIDGGDAFKTISRAFNGSICSESRMPLDRKFYDDMREIIQFQRQQYNSLFSCEIKQPGNAYKLFRQAVKEKKDPLEIEARLLNLKLESMNDWLNNSYGKLPFFSKLFIRDTYKKTILEKKKAEERLQEIQRIMKKNLKNKLTSKLNENMKENLSITYRAQSGGLYTEPIEDDLRRCFLYDMEAKTENYSLKLALELLHNGIPFLCSGNYDLGNGTTGSHVALKIGYRYNESMDKNVEWKHLDSNFGTPTWGWSGPCDYIIYIRP